jgi:D-beta-D-heptose 7-phosphate kinase/D-beta-D-heptose 1-phosphate adenosyltransferase
MLTMSNKIVDRSKLKDIIAGLKEQGRKVVFTNGCFDLIHVGHVRYLQEAKKFGDVLVLGLNSDKSVSTIKPGRPVTPQDQRAEVLSVLIMIDYITTFDEETPYELIKALQPDVLVKGADWKPDEIVGNDIVKEVHTIPFVQGVSTSEIIKKMKKLK